MSSAEVAKFDLISLDSAQPTLRQGERARILVEWKNLALEPGIAIRVLCVFSKYDPATGAFSVYGYSKAGVTWMLGSLYSGVTPSIDTIRVDPLLFQLCPRFEVATLVDALVVLTAHALRLDKYDEYVCGLHSEDFRGIFEVEPLPYALRLFTGVAYFSP